MTVSSQSRRLRRSTADDWTTFLHSVRHREARWPPSKWEFIVFRKIDPFFRLVLVGFCGATLVFVPLMSRAGASAPAGIHAESAVENGASGTA